MVPLHLMVAARAHCEDAKQPQAGDSAGRIRALIWSDEFNGPNGGLPDPSKWSVVTNDSVYGNKEFEYYTNRASSLHKQNG
jgi:hypothetical protein